MGSLVAGRGASGRLPTGGNGSAERSQPTIGVVVSTSPSGFAEGCESPAPSVLGGTEGALLATGCATGAMLESAVSTGTGRATGAMLESEVSTGTGCATGAMLESGVSSDSAAAAAPPITHWRHHPYSGQSEDVPPRTSIVHTNESALNQSTSCFVAVASLSSSVCAGCSLP